MGVLDFTKSTVMDDGPPLLPQQKTVPESESQQHLVVVVLVLFSIQAGQLNQV